MERGIGWARWARIRTQAFQRDNYRCQQCGTSRRLEGHHIKSVASGGQHIVENLLSLCAKCHIKRHRPEHLKARDDRMTPAQREWDSIGKGTLKMTARQKTELALSKSREGLQAAALDDSVETAKLEELTTAHAGLEKRYQAAVLSEVDTPDIETTDDSAGRELRGLIAAF